VIFDVVRVLCACEAQVCLTAARWCVTMVLMCWWVLLRCDAGFRFQAGLQA
jgi:hypothetical protein